MSKEEFMKIQTCVLKVNIHCDGCKHKVKKILQKIEGVFKTTIDSEQGKVTVLGNVNPDVLVKKLAKSGKHAELWGSSKATNNNNNNQSHLANQLKNMQMLDNGSKGGNNKNNNNNNKKEGQKGNINNINQPKGGQPTPQQLQHLQQMKGFQDLKLPQLKDMKLGPNPNNNHKAVKFAEEEDFSDDDYYDDDLDDDCDLDDDEYDDEEELDDPRHPLNKMKPVMGNAPKGMPINMMVLNANHPQNAAANGKKGGAGANGVPVAGGNNGNGGKKGGPAGGNPNQGGGGGKNGGKNGGALPQEVNKNGGGNHGGPNGSKKGNNGAPMGVSDGFPTMGAGPNGGNMGLQRAAAMNMAMGQMGSLPMNQMGNIPAVQGLPAAAAMNGGGGGGGGGYFQGAGPDVMPGNPYHQQQQYMAAMMNQQRAVGAANERFQPMMHARPPPAVNYMPPYPYQYPYPYPHPQPQPDPYTHYFSDENTSSCSIM
ncbi:hypothetical protein HRI_004500100 [Hibiscus trionum]|uniref:HMA domain-containing protein n=1 Tax=Hibiscus trionum TaxID=183268 RepID=A0A9W7JAP8_HIBTR|nr:hypothetical protein HRI_004500100 [Hibiscus trionum]